MYNSQTVISNIDSLLKAQGKQKKSLNEYCHIDKSTINNSADSKYGLGAKILYDIGDYLDCSVDFLLGRAAASDLNRTPQNSIAPDSLSEEENNLLQMFRQFNKKGQDKALDLLDDMVQAKKVSKKRYRFIRRKRIRRIDRINFVQNKNTAPKGG